MLRSSKLRARSASNLSLFGDGQRPNSCQDGSTSIATRRFPSMQFIELTQDQIAVLDDEDFTRLSPFHWCYRGERNGGPGYAMRHVREGKKYRTAYLHREVTGPVPPGHEVVFLNGDRLDCRRVNLRAVPKEEARRLHRRARSD